MDHAVLTLLLTSYLTLPYLNLPYTLPYLTPYIIPYLNSTYLTLPYLTSSLALPYILPYFTLPLLTLRLTSYLTIRITLSYSLRHTSYLTFDAKWGGANGAADLQ